MWLAVLSGDDDGDGGAGGAVCGAGADCGEAGCGRDDTAGRDDEHHVYWGEAALEEREEKGKRWKWVETMDEFVAIGTVVPQESDKLIALRDATYAIGQVCHGKGMIGVFCVSYCVCGRVGVTADVCDGSFGGSAGSIVGVQVDVVSAAWGHRDRGSSSGAHRSASPRQVAGVQRVSPLPASGSVLASAQACACLSPAAARCFVINCREHNITFDFEGNCGVLFQLAGHLIAGVVEFVACERSEELAARAAAQALETVAVQMLHCAFVSALSWEEKKRMEKRMHGENAAVARGMALGRLAGLGGGIVKSAREKGDSAKVGFNNRSRIGAAVPLKDSVRIVDADKKAQSSINLRNWESLKLCGKERKKEYYRNSSMPETNWQCAMMSNDIGEEGRSDENIVEVHESFHLQHRTGFGHPTEGQPGVGQACCGVGRNSVLMGISQAGYDIGRSVEWYVPPSSFSQKNIFEAGRDILLECQIQCRMRFLKASANGQLILGFCLEGYVLQEEKI
ncbi:uncharacterized protein MONOS_10034 [Monocercomonoides exilis]|uniref:uncharacterized protein n=1 Tax=Monocercomonoides exilis TaxID=2049356 RepID=UPI00355AA6E7|nr:hypothetical protein MONOS_10034 [Monocercomonoides exilis]|eukprot:MONOS_10034.1-p1 / transcript=MONOS_10034.1 / gene=MONOS_10034 / organism=Monocercomonoides_exilis_PA203 / gene_product=unspecified product / transcript_product=unspecified product / location=Mono_scaffold00438:43492-45816(-) / protein_length=509 / sequence_SO=supercontig / SO=protein_coding / is_pseudo=false